MTLRTENNIPVTLSAKGRLVPLLFLATVLCCSFTCNALSQQAPDVERPGVSAVEQSVPSARQDKPEGALSPVEERLAKMEKTLQEVKITGEKAEIRSYYNKMIARELIRFVKAILVALIFIAVSFPLIIWLISRRRLLGLSGLSDEAAATLLVVEERQAKLTAILKEIQSEVEYLHSMSGPDLKNLLEQAEKYLEQNKRDLERAGTKR